MLNKAIKAEYIKQRKYIVSRNRILAEAGLPTLSVPKVRELANTRQLKKALKQIEDFRAEKRGTLKGAVQWVQEQEQKKQEKREQRQRQKEESRKRRNERRHEQRREEWKEELPERKQWFVDYMEEKYGLKIKNEREFKQFTDYVNKRRAMQNRKEKYEMEKFVDEYNQLKEKGFMKAKPFSVLMKDFNAFMGDQQKLAKRMNKMKLKYDKGFVDQLYSEYIDRLINQAIDKGVKA